MFLGRGIVVRGVKNVTIKNAKIRGFRIAIYAENCPNLTIENMDVSNNYRQRLKSTPQRENEDDWLYGHENDKNEWLRYGAGIYLYKCDGATVKNCRARNGQNGICLVNCNDATVVGNDMSFMSGWGLAMWRSSRCKVIGNRFDYCVRGYSHGVYARGQDSTGILVYEQCSDNTFAYNHATHGGDGFFLYAGNETVNKTGEGGCNRNLLYRNDFSYAVANGIESTFSDQNVFVLNKLHDCEHGIWAGYSTQSHIWQNDFEHCKNGISIEHGRNNQIQFNDFSSCERGVSLWWDDDKDLLKSAYAKKQGAESRGEVVVGNRFKECRKDVNADRSENLTIGGNRRSDSKDTETSLADIPDLRQRGFFDDMAFPWGPSGYVRIPVVNAGPPDSMGYQPLDSLRGIPEGKENILIDEWGPYDFQSVKVIPFAPSAWNSTTVQVLAPQKPFTVRVAEGDVELSPASGTAPAVVTIRRKGRSDAPTKYRAEVNVDGRKFDIDGLLLFAKWQLRYFGWTPDIDPRKGDENWKKITGAAPLRETTADGLDFVWYSREPAEGVPADHFALIAEAKMKLPPGKWKLRTVSDDGVRVFVDKKKLIDNWTWHVPTEDKAELMLNEAAHSFRVEYFEIDGNAQLQLFLEPNESR